MNKMPTLPAIMFTLSSTGEEKSDPRVGLLVYETWIPVLTLVRWSESKAGQGLGIVFTAQHRS
jgi:hypothetical protein